MAEVWRCLFLLSVPTVGGTGCGVLSSIVLLLTVAFHSHMILILELFFFNLHLTVTLLSALRQNFAPHPQLANHLPVVWTLQAARN